MDKDRSKSGSEGVLTVVIHERINVPHIRGHFHYCAVIHGTGGQIPNPGHLYSSTQALAIAETSHWYSFSCTVQVFSCLQRRGRETYFPFPGSDIYLFSQLEVGAKNLFFFLNRKGCRVGERRTGINVDVGKGVPNQGFIITTLLDESNHSASIPPLAV